MTSDKGRRLRISYAGTAVACGMGLMASALMAEDASELRPLTDESVNLLQTVESGTGRLGISQGDTPAKTGNRSRLKFEDLDAAASGLNDALDGARSKLDQLREATEIAAIAASLRDELEASAEENNRLAAALTEREATQRSLETSLEKSGDQILELTKALEESRSEASDFNQRLRKSREQTATTDAARVAAVERASRAESQLADSRGQNDALLQENRSLKDKLKMARSQRDVARSATETTRQERDAAHQELDLIRLRIAGLLRSVLHANEPIDSELRQSGAALSGSQTAVASTENEPAKRTYEIVRTSNIRAEPRRDAARIDIGVAGEKVSILRKVPNVDWFEIKTKRGTTGFIFGELIQPNSD